MWAYRKILRISYREHRTIVSIPNLCKITTRLLTSINNSYLRQFGPISKRTNGLEKLTIEDQVRSRIPRGRSPTRRIDQTKEMKGHDIQ